MSDSEIVFGESAIFPETNAIRDEVAAHPRAVVIDQRTQHTVVSTDRVPAFDDAGEPIIHQGPLVIQQAGDDVEYDVVLPGGGKETIPAGQLEGALDTVALAQRRLMQMKTIRMLLSKAKQNRKNAESQVTRTVKSRKKRDLQKASRKKNRGR
jgi:hypothetical protein